MLYDMVFESNQSYYNASSRSGYKLEKNSKTRIPLKMMKIVQAKRKEIEELLAGQAHLKFY